MVLDYDKKLVRESDAARADGRLACGVGKWGRLSDVCQSRCPPRRLSRHRQHRAPFELLAPSVTLPTAPLATRAACCAVGRVALPTAPALAIIFIVKYALI